MAVKQDTLLDFRQTAHSHYMHNASNIGGLTVFWASIVFGVYSLLRDCYAKIMQPNDYTILVIAGIIIFLIAAFLVAELYITYNINLIIYQSTESALCIYLSDNLLEVNNPIVCINKLFIRKIMNEGKKDSYFQQHPTACIFLTVVFIYSLIPSILLAYVLMLSKSYCFYSKIIFILAIFVPVSFMHFIASKRLKQMRHKSYCFFIGERL